MPFGEQLKDVHGADSDADNNNNHPDHTFLKAERRLKDIPRNCKKSDLIIFIKNYS